MTSTARHRRARTGAAKLSREHPLMVRLGQLGWLVKGVVYVLAGSLSVIVLARSSGMDLVRGPSQEASPTGAIKEVAGLGGGRVLLIVLSGGLLFYALWRVVTALLPGATGAEAVATRIGYLVSAAIYGTFSFTAWSIARHPSHKEDGNRKVTEISARLLGSTAGRYALAAAGVIAVGAGMYRVAKGLQGDVTKELHLSGLSSGRLALTTRLAIVGEVGRGLAIGLIGVFLVRAAINVDASEATGLDGALRRLARVAWGRALVAIVAVGFLLYGVVCIGTFHRRKLQAPQ